MAPPALLGRYKLYKTGTKKLVQWLAYSASRCCDLTSIIKPTRSGITPRSTRDDQEPHAIQLRTLELIKLAQAIAGSDPPVEISQNIIDIAKDVIAGREECAEWYAGQTSQSGSKLEKENENHRYFIMVLQRVLKILTEARATRPKSEEHNTPEPKTKGQAHEGSQQHDLTNLFNCLEVEEVSASPLGEASASADKQSLFTPQVLYTLEQKEEDSGFAIWCFLQDLHDVRKSVRETWQEYCQGDTSFLVASSITDTAFGLLRCADEEFAKISPVQSSEWNTLLAHLGLTFFTQGAAIWMHPDIMYMSTPPRSIHARVNPMELLCPLGACCVEQHCAEAKILCANDRSLDKGRVNITHLKHRSVVESGDASGGKLDAEPEEEEAEDEGTEVEEAEDEGTEVEEAEDQVDRTPYPNLCEFTRVLNLLGPELHGLAHRAHAHCNHCDLLDEFVLGLVEMHKKRGAPVWMVVACQVYLDIYDLLGHHTVHGTTVLEEAYQRQRQTATDLDEYIVEAEARVDDPYGLLDSMRTMAN